MTANAFTEMATLPASLRPPQNMYFAAEVGGTAARAFIDANGRFAIYSFVNNGQTQGTIFFTVA